MFELVWEQDLDLNTCSRAQFDIEKSITIEVVSKFPLKHTFIEGIYKIEIILNDIKKTSFVVEDIDTINSVKSSSEVIGEKVLTISAMNDKNWKELISNNNFQCSKEGYKILSNEDRSSNIDIYNCFVWKFDETQNILSNGCDNFFQSTPVKLLEVKRELLLFTNYLDIILAFFDHLPPCVDIFYGINVDKKLPFLDHPNTYLVL